MAFQPVPTYQDPVEVNPRTGKSEFSPTWLSWFLTLSQGGLGSTIQHNSTLGLQGGSSGQYYHLTSAQLGAVPFRTITPLVAITVGASPFTFQNTHTFDEDVIVLGPSVTKIEFGRGVVFRDVGLLQGMYHLSPGDFLRVTYTVLPVMTEVTR